MLLGHNWSLGARILAVCLGVQILFCIKLFCTFRMITNPAQGDSLHGAPDLERLTNVWCCFHLRIIAPIVVCFSPSCFPMVLLPIPALCRSTILSLTSLVNSLVLPMVVRQKAEELLRLPGNVVGSFMVRESPKQRGKIRAFYST